jgi:archaellum biogenesis protein FlaJ (TadC family)
MKLPTYKSTVGLDNFPESERLRIFQATHKRLMRDSPDYRKKFLHHMASFICVASVPLVAAIFLPMQSPTMIFPMIGATTFVTFLFLGIKHQNWMNIHIGSALPSDFNQID